MEALNRNECRVLGVLVEKSLTTPGQYPLTVNAVISGASQKSNRHPVITLDESDALDALDGLRAKSLCREVMMAGSRVLKYRHIARETLDVTTSELVLLAEMLMRGPQSVGDLRGRASRMHPLESLEVVNNLLESLMKRAEPLVAVLPPPPGSRAALYGHLLAGRQGLAGAASSTESATSTASASISSAPSSLEPRVARLEAAVDRLQKMLEQAGLDPDGGEVGRVDPD